jgi:hypothetical protein
VAAVHAKRQDLNGPGAASRFLNCHVRSHGQESVTMRFQVTAILTAAVMVALIAIMMFGLWPW